MLPSSSASAEDILARDHFPLLCGTGTAYPDAPIRTAGREAVAPRKGPEMLCLPFHGAVEDRDVERMAQIIARCAAEEGAGL